MKSALNKMVSKEWKKHNDLFVGLAQKVMYGKEVHIKVGQQREETAHELAVGMKK